MNYLTLTPAYGRDYKSAAAARKDYFDNKDFVINQIMHPYDGKYVNKEQLPDTTVNIRYKKLANITVVKPTDKK